MKPHLHIFQGTWYCTGLGYQVAAITPRYAYLKWIGGFTNTPLELRHCMVDDHYLKIIYAIAGII